jgi:hypothetical protein
LKSCASGVSRKARTEGQDVKQQLEELVRLQREAITKPRI